MVKPKIGLSMLYKLSEDFTQSLQSTVKRNVKIIEVVDDGLHTLNKRRVSELADIGDSYGVKYSVHAPFADINIASPSKPILKTAIKRLQQSLANAGAIDAFLWVFHPGLETGISVFYPGEAWNQNCKNIKFLCKNAKDNGVKVAIENLPDPYPFLMKSVNHFQKFYEETGEDVGLALDIGHANLNGQIELFLENLSDRIIHVHAHDNNGKTDQHLGIGYGTVNWEKTAELLKKTSYSGTVIVESVEHVSESLQKLKKLLI